MITNWRNWCRLCAQIPLEEEEDKFQDLEDKDLVQRCFNVSAEPIDGIPAKVCPSCSNFLVQLEQFSQKCLKSDQLFNEFISAVNANPEEDLVAIRTWFDEGEIASQSISTTTAVEKDDLKDFSKTILLQQTSSNSADPNVIAIKLEPSEIGGANVEIIEEEVEEEDGGSDYSDSRDEEDNSMDMDDAEYVAIEKKTTPKRTRKRRSKTDDIIFKCKDCDKVYNSRRVLMSHQKKKHSGLDLKPYKCDQCDKSFVNKRSLELHTEVHFPEELRQRHPCPYCDKTFTKTVNVHSHIRTVHIGLRPFVCEECGKTFCTKGGLKEHQLIHSDDKPFQCAHCPKKFKNLPRLKVHEDIHNDTLYICPHCGLQLNTKRTLNMHMVVHSDVKKYKCQYCGNEFKRSKALKNHLILHTGLRPYTCPFCDKTFANGSNCRTHKRKAHPAQLAAMEAAGQEVPNASIPKLNQLQPRTPKQEMNLSQPESTVQQVLLQIKEAPSQAIYTNTSPA